MERELAEKIAYRAIKSSSSLSSVIPELTTTAPKDEARLVGMKIAEICAKIHQDIVGPIFSKFPEIEKEFEDRINKSGEL